MIKIIIGLGNPGKEYENTRHNIGFSVLDSFKEKYNFQKKQEKKLLSFYGRAQIELYEESHEIILCWPTTFMNKSGEAIFKLLDWFKLEPKDMIVVHDEVAIDLGRIKIGFDSGSAGHHGIESIIQALGGTKEFVRLRVGVGPDPGGDKRADYVLNKFTLQEEPLVKQVVNTSIEALETIMIKGINESMNKFNGLEINL